MELLTSDCPKFSLEIFEERIRKFLLTNNWESNSCANDLFKIFSHSCSCCTENRIANDIINQKVTEFSKVFIAGKNSDFDQFKSQLRTYDFSVTCGFVWMSADFGYRCRTCCLTPDMVLCVPCFSNSNHDGHDFNKIECAPGGVCDCGNEAALSELGFCSHHGVGKAGQQQDPPDSLICRLKVLMPFYLKSFLFAAWTLMETSHRNPNEVVLSMSFINELLTCGWVTQKIIAEIMIDKDLYRDFITEIKDSDFYGKYELEILSELKFTFPEDKVGSQKLPNDTLLDFFMFIAVKLRFNYNFVYFLNGMLSIDSYKEVFIKCYVNHYSRIAFDLYSLTESYRDGLDIMRDTTSSILNISAQLFSTESMVLKIVNDRGLHYLNVHCLLNMFRPALVPLETIGHIAINCRSAAIQYYPWWTLETDLNYIFSHKSVVDTFITDLEFLKDWATLLKWMQFMNPFEVFGAKYYSTTYSHSLTLEVRISIFQMMNICYHYRSKDDTENVRKFVNFFVTTLADFIEDLECFGILLIEDGLRKSLSFHLPLMRNVACYLSLALFHHHLPLSELLENISTKQIIRWFDEAANALLGCQEALIGYWSRYGTEIRLAAHEYKQNTYCNFLIDMDIFAAQVCSAVIPSSAVIYTLTDPTKLLRGIEFSLKPPIDQDRIDLEKKPLALEAWFMNLCWILDLRKEMSIDDAVKLRKEICCQLCWQPIKRSDLNEHLPKRTEIDTHYITDIDSVLNEVSNFTAPTFDQYSGSLQSGCYTLKSELWDTDYDPVFQSLRSASKQNFLMSLSKYREYYRQKENVSKPNSLWPPYRIPPPLHGELSRLENILHCKDLAYILFCSLNMFLNNDALVTEDVLALIVHLIHRSLLIDEPHDNLDDTSDLHKTRFLANPYKVNNIRSNIRYNVDINSELKNTDDLDLMLEEIKSTPLEIQWESILSLLLKIHSKLHSVRLQAGGKSLSLTKSMKRIIHFTMRKSDVVSSKSSKTYPLVYHYSSDNFQKAKVTGLGINWGDGVDFIGNLLDYIVWKDDENSEYLLKLIEDIKGTKASPQSKVGSLEQQLSNVSMRRMSSVDEKKQKALERRRQLLSNMKVQQKTFVTAHQLDSLDTSIKDESIETYQCVICQLNKDPIDDRMVLLGIVCTASSLMYMHDNHRSNSRDMAMVRRWDYKDKLSFKIPILCDSIIIQTCGHVVHQHCFDQYKTHKATIRELQEIIHCPLCRRDVHHLTPIQTHEFAKSSSDSFYSILKDRLTKSFHTNSNYLHTNIIAPDIPWITIEYQACSLLRSQLELELIACLSLPDQYKTITKRCQWPHFISYLRSLNANVIALIKYCNPLLGTSFSGILSVSDRLKSSIRNTFLFEVPSDVFLGFIPYVWPCEDHILHILKACIVMAYVKGTVMIGSKLDQSEYDSRLNLSPDADDFQKQFEYILKRKHYARSQTFSVKKSFFINIVKDFKNTRQQPLSLMLKMYQRMYYDATPNSAKEQPSLNNDGCYDSAAIDLVQCLLPLLRIAAVLKLHLLLAEDLPENFPITVADAAENNDLISQFNRLCEYLNLPQPNDPTEKCSAHLARLISTCLKSTMYKNFNDAVNTYINAEFIKAYTEEKEKMELKGTTLNILNVGNELYPPHLIDLPNNYEDFFNAYRNQRFSDDCSHNSLLYGLCLICGKLVCFNCQTFNQHTDTCCMGIGIFIEVSTSIIYVFNYKDGGQWGSVYLDCYGEEDLGLKRGRPMLIDDHRLKLLEQQWLTQSFKNFQTTWPRN